MPSKRPPKIGDNARVTFGSDIGKRGRIEWISSGRTQFDRLYGMRIDGLLLGFSRGEIRLIGKRKESK